MRFEVKQVHSKYYYVVVEGRRAMEPEPTVAIRNQ
jgi:hypothetical protein